jgi:hypothetical protein
MSIRPAGQILRIAGLLIEMLGIVAFGLRTRADVPMPSFVRGLSSDTLWIMVGIGFAIWLLGSVMAYWPSPKAGTEKRSPRDDGLNL